MRLIGKLLIFASGAVIGAASSFFYFRNVYSKKYDEAINYYYSNAPKANVNVEIPKTVEAKENDISTTDPEIKQITSTGIIKKNYSDMKGIINENNYLGKEETSEDYMSEHFIKKASEVIREVAPGTNIRTDHPHRIDAQEVEEYIAKGYETLDLTFYEDMVLAESRSHEALEEPSTTIGHENYRHLMDYSDDLYVVDDRKTMLYFINHSDEEFEEIY